MDILIVDDDQLFADGLQRLLLALGHRLRMADRADVAIALLQEQPVDVVLLDWVLPNGGGRRILDAMENGEVAWTRVVLLSGSPEYAPSESAMPVALLPKPFRLNQLREMLEGPGTICIGRG